MGKLSSRGQDRDGNSRVATAAAAGVKSLRKSWSADTLRPEAEVTWMLCKQSRQSRGMIMLELLTRVLCWRCQQTRLLSLHVFVSLNSQLSLVTLNLLSTMPVVAGPGAGPSTFDKSEFVPVRR